YLPGGINTIRIFNVLSYLGSVVLMNKIGKRILVNKSEFIVGIVYVAFVPLALYIPFIYGNLMGFFFSLLAIEAAFCFCEKKDWKSMVVLIISASFSVLIKQNFLIPVIGIFLFLFVQAIFDKKIKIVVVSLTMVFFVWFTGILVNVRMETMSDANLNQGIPATAWVAMGMQQTLMANGWYNAYNEKTYIENDCNPEKTNQVAIEEIKNRLSYFVSHPSQLVFFFLKKDSSQWNHPNFEGFWVNYDCQREKFDIPTKKVLGIFQKITNEPGSLKVNEYLNLYQTIILIGVCAWIVLCRKDIKKEQLLLALIVIGGFVFHTFWEGKSQYTITYYALLIPYGIAGYQGIVKELLEIDVKGKIHLKELWENKAFRYVVVVCAILIICSCLEFKLGNSPLCYEDNLYKEYLQQIN
nr:glycosyltransferase family 39 protein [Lachnospiraceae bacterium]